MAATKMSTEGVFQAVLLNYLVSQARTVEGSVNRAKEGTVVADTAGKALQAIVTDVTKVADLLNGISRASDEQAQGVEQINTAVTQMDQVTQQNAAVAEESAAAAEELSAQSLTVKEMVDTLLALVGGKAGVGQQGRVASPAAVAAKATQSKRVGKRKPGQIAAKPPVQTDTPLPASDAAQFADSAEF